MIETSEAWRPLCGFDGYEVSDLGQVRSYRPRSGHGPLRSEPLVLRQKNHRKTGYMVINLRDRGGRSRTVLVHRLVARAFIGPCPDGKEVAHNDGSKVNNVATNLRYATVKENSADRVIHGTVRTLRGEQAPSSKLKEEDVRRIWDMRLSGASYRKIATAFGLRKAYIGAIIRGEVWGHMKQETESPSRKSIISVGSTRKRWQFVWCDESSPPTNGDDHDWRSKIIRTASFEKAMDVMLDFVRGRPFVCLVDYECAALHVPYNRDRHAEHFYRIDRTEHGLREYVG